jgi:hypothetical protein
MECAVLRKSLIAAGLTTGLLACTGLVLAASARGSEERLAHSCSAVDKKFIRTATMSMLAVGELGRDYLAGEQDAGKVVDQAERAARTVTRVKPTDPALEKTRLLIGAMLNEYGRAIRSREDHGTSGLHMFRAYGLAAFASDVLRSASPELLGLGCDVSPLL